MLYAQFHTHVLGNIGLTHNILTLDQWDNLTPGMKWVNLTWVIYSVTVKAKWVKLIALPHDHMLLQNITSYFNSLDVTRLFCFVFLFYELQDLHHVHHKCNNNGM